VIDRLELVRDIERANKDLLAICNRLMGAEPGTEEAEALSAVADAVACLELYLYPESRWTDGEMFLDDGD